MTSIPLIDGAFLIDNSTLEHYQACAWFYYATDIRLRVPVANRAGRNFGSTLHAGWRTRYRMCGADAVPEGALPVINQSMREWLEEHPQPEDDFRNYDHACRVMAAYNEVYGNEPFKIISQPCSWIKIENSGVGFEHLLVPGNEIHWTGTNGTTYTSVIRKEIGYRQYSTTDGEIYIEQIKEVKPATKRIIESSFVVPLGTVNTIPILYCGRIDLGIEDNEGIWSFDHKTAFQFGGSFTDQMEQDGGQRGYTWALRKTLGTSVVGYKINAVRIRRPNKDGITPVDETDFLRIPKHLSEEDLEDWRSDVLNLIEHIFYCHTHDQWPRSRRSCVGRYGRCDMFDVCTVARGSREAALESNLFTANTWTPLNITTRKENYDNGKENK